jgi:hypothetical protein
LSRYTMVAYTASMLQATFQFGNRDVARLMVGRCRLTLCNPH